MENKSAGSKKAEMGGASAAAEERTANERPVGEDQERFHLSVSDTIKKLFTAGVSAAFMTEESIRSFVSELKLPKETINMVLLGAAKSKEEMMNRVGNEFTKIVSKIDLVKEASRFVEEHKFRINAEIEVIRKDKETEKVASVVEKSEAGS